MVIEFRYIHALPAHNYVLLKGSNTNLLLTHAVVKVLVLNFSCSKFSSRIAT